MIKDTDTLSEIKNDWNGVEALREKLQVSAFASMGMLGDGIFPFTLSNAACGYLFNVSPCNLSPGFGRGFSFGLGRAGNCGAGRPGEGNSIQLGITLLIPRQMRDILRKLLLIWISGLAVFAGRLD